MSECFLKQFFGKISSGRVFEAVLSARCGRSGEYLRMMVRPNGLPHARFGQAVSRKLSPRATERNYMKRVGRELFRRHLQDFAGLDVVLLHKKAFVPGMFEVLSSEFGVLAQNVQKCRDSSKPSSEPTR